MPKAMRFLKPTPLLLLCLLSPTGCFQPPEGLPEDNLDSGYALLDLEITDQMHVVQDAKQVTLRPILWLRGGVDYAPEQRPTLTVAFTERDACSGRGLTTVVTRLDGAQQVVPEEPLAPWMWHCLSVDAHRGKEQWTFRTEKVPPAEHQLWPPPNAFIPANTDRFIAFTSYDASAASDWTSSLRNPNPVAVSNGAQECLVEGKSSRCIEVWPRDNLAPGEAQLGLIRHDGLASSHIYQVAEHDDSVPSLLPISCMPGAASTADASACLRTTVSDTSLLLQFDEPVLVHWSHHGVKAFVRAPFGEAQFAIEGSATSKVEFIARDMAGNTRHVTLGIQRQLDLEPISLVAVRPNPRGPEPDQELVVLHNHSSSERWLSGFQLGSTLGSAEHVPDLVLKGGESATLVPPRFDPHHDADEAPPVGTRLVRMEQSLTGNGLANQGEELQLWDAQGRWVSGSPALKAGAGECLRRVREESHAALASHFVFADCFGPLRDN